MVYEKKNVIQAPILSGQPEVREDGISFLRECASADRQGEDCILRGIRACGEEFYKLSLKGVILENCVFTDCGFEKGSFVDVVFQNCDLSNCRLEDGFFNRCVLRSVKGVGADFHESLFREMRVEDGLFSFANFSGTRWENVLLSGCDLQDGYMEECVFKKTVFHSMRLNRVNFFHTSLKGIDLRGSELEGLTVSDERKELKGAVVDLYQAAELARLLGIVVK